MPFVFILKNATLSSEAEEGEKSSKNSKDKNMHSPCTHPNKTPYELRQPMIRPEIKTVPIVEMSYKIHFLSYYKKTTPARHND